MDRLDDLCSKAFKRADTNIHGKLKNYFLTHYSHCLVPGFNLSKSSWIDTWDVDNVIGLYQEFPWNCDLPKPLLPPVKISSNVFNKGDPALQLVAIKTQIANDVQRALGHYQKHKKAFSAVPLVKDIKWKEHVGSHRTTIPRYVADLANMIEMDPDPYFLGRYNWYYTGGSLATVQLDGENLLLFPYMGDLVVCPVTPTESSLWKPNIRAAASCKMDCMIYETRINTQSDVCRILGRSKNNCVFYSLTEDREKLRISQVHERQSKIPFVSADLDPINCNTFCTMNVERTLTLWDMVSCKSVRSNAVDASKVLEDKWGSVRFMKSDPNTIVFVDRCCVHYLDIRVSNDCGDICIRQIVSLDSYNYGVFIVQTSVRIAKTHRMDGTSGTGVFILMPGPHHEKYPYERPVLTLCPKDNLEACESLCMLVPSCTEDYNYVASYHSLLMCDRRSPQACVQQKWIHQFKSAPLLAVVHTRDEKEMVILSSQVAGETAIILNTWEGRDDPHSYNMPYTPPSVLQTLKESKVQGRCLEPSLRKRLELSNAGISVAVDRNGDLSLFLQNSIGDIFYQCNTHEEPLDNYSLVNYQAYCAMEAWEKRILSYERPITPLVITERPNMHHAFDNFSNKNPHYEPDIRPPELFRDPEWKQPLEKLKTYVDILAPELLAVWEVTEDNVPTTQPAVPHQKVLNWLDMAGGKCSDQSQEDPDFGLTLVNTQELFSVSQEPELVDIAEDVSPECYYPAVRVTTGRKPQSKKRTYVAGF